MVRVGLDLLPQSRNRMIDRSRDRRVWIRPDLTEQLLAGHDVTSPFGQIAKDVELAVTQVHDAVALYGAQRQEIDRHRAERQLLDAWTRTGQHDLDSRQELLQIERLGDVVVGAEGETAQLVHLLRARCEND